MTSPDRLEALEQQLRHPGLNKRIEALNELATIDSVLAIPILQRLAQEKDVGLRRIAVMGLGNHRTETALGVLQELLDHEADSAIQAEAANSIFEFGAIAIPRLETVFAQSDSWLVKQTIVSLMIESEDKAALHRTITAALNDSVQTVKEAGILGFIRLWGTEFEAAAFAQVEQLTQDDYWRNRWRATIALQECQHPKAKELLLKMQQDEHFRVVAAALEILNDGAIPPQDML